MLNANNVDLEDLFYQYNTSGSGFMSHDEFREFMRSLPGVPIRNDQIREIIHKVWYEKATFTSLFLNMGLLSFFAKLRSR